MNFQDFTDIEARIRATPGKLDKEELVMAALDACGSIDERIALSYLLYGQLGSATENLISGIKEKTIANAFNLEGRNSMEDIRALLPKKHTGGKQQHLLEWFEDTRAQVETGQRTQNFLERLIHDQLTDLPSPEATGLALEILIGKVPNKLGDIEVVYAAARRQHPDQCFPNGKWNMDVKRAIKKAWNVRPDVGYWIRGLEEFPLDELLATAIPTPGIALEAQKANRLPKKDGLDAIFNHHAGETVIETKMDGQRCHVHILPDGEVKLFARSLQEKTHEFPDVVQAIESLDLPDTILDGELLAMSDDGTTIMSFEDLSKRIGKKNLSDDDFAAGLMLYDTIRWRGTDLSDTTLRARRVLLEEINGQHPHVQVIEQRLVTSKEELHQLLLEAHEAGEEGLVAKDLDAYPEPGERRKAWFKLKPDYMGDDTAFGDTMDLVVIGYNKGRGRRHGKIGALWLGVRDEATQFIYPFAKVGTGFTDEDLDWWTQELEASAQDNPGSIIIAGQAKPDYWVPIHHVVEVKAAQLSRSPLYKAGAEDIDGEERGWSLRFPRILRVRDDKPVHQSTSIQEILA